MNGAIVATTGGWCGKQTTIEVSSFFAKKQALRCEFKSCACHSGFMRHSNELGSMQVYFLVVIFIFSELIWTAN
jgi:hypothetical protein